MYVYIYIQYIYTYIYVCVCGCVYIHFCIQKKSDLKINLFEFTHYMYETVSSTTCIHCIFDIRPSPIVPMNAYCTYECEFIRSRVVYMNLNSHIIMYDCVISAICAYSMLEYV